MEAMIPMDELDPADFSLLLQRTKTNPEVAGRLILGFKEHFASIGADLRHELATGNLKEAGRLARSLARVAGMLGAVRLGEAASGLEALLAQGNRQAHQAIAQLEQAMLPIMNAASSLQQGESKGTAHAVSGHSPQAKECVLIIDDEPSMRDLLEDILRDDYRPLLASDAITGLRLAGQEAPDLILLDVELPDVTGFTVLKCLKEDAAAKAIPVIFVTGSNDIASETQGLRLGAVDYLTKPINPSVLMMRIHSQIKIKRAENEARRRLQREHYLELVAEFERSALLEENRQLQLKIKDDFLSHISHELRGPILSIDSSVRLVLNGLAGEVNSQQVEHLGMAARNLEHLLAMIEDLPEAARHGSGKLSIQNSDIFIAETTH